jgi:cytoskeletal protein RodZ
VLTAPDDPSEAPTGQYDYSDEPFDSTETQRAWYLKPWVLALWGVTVLLLLAIIAYGLVILATGHGSGPATTKPSTTTSRSTTPTPTTTPSSTLPNTTEPSVETTSEPASPGTTQPSTQRPRHRWWNGNVPSIPRLPTHVPGVSP